MKNSRRAQILNQNNPGNDAESKIVKIMPKPPVHMTNTAGAHNRIFPDHYFENVETSGWDTAH